MDKLVSVKSAWVSKINWVQAVSFVVMMLAMFGIEVPDDVRVAAVTAISGATAVITWVLRTWFTVSITPESAKKV